MIQAFKNLTRETFELKEKQSSENKKRKLNAPLSNSHLAVAFGLSQTLLGPS